MLVQPDERFIRHGEDLTHRVKLGLSEAALGKEIAVPLVDGDTHDMQISAGTQPGTVLRIPRQGMPRLRGRGRGDLLVEVDVDVPEKLSREEEDLLREFAQARGEDPAPPKRRPWRRAR